MNPLKFALWLIIASIVMLFAAWTSAFLVRKAEGNWYEFDLPSLLWITTGIIVASSFTMQWAVIAARRNNLEQIKLALTITTFLGLAFLMGQWYAWVALVQQKIFLVGNPSGSFMYVLTGAHAAHIIAGLLFLIIVLVSAFRYQVHSKKMLQIEMCATFWHFLDALWLYLFVFLLLNR